MRTLFHSVSNRAAALSMKFLFGCVARVNLLQSENANRGGAFLFASNHISHFDAFILSSIVRRKIDWMAMAEFFPVPLLGFFLRAVDAFPVERDRADRATIRTAIERLKQGRIVGIFPEGGIRDGARSLLEGAPLRPGASTLAHLAGVPIVPCVIVGSDRLYLVLVVAEFSEITEVEMLDRMTDRADFLVYLEATLQRCPLVSAENTVERPFLTRQRRAFVGGSAESRSERQGAQGCGRQSVLQHITTSPAVRRHPADALRLRAR